MPGSRSMAQSYGLWRQETTGVGFTEYFSESLILVDAMRFEGHTVASYDCWSVDSELMGTD